MADVIRNDESNEMAVMKFPEDFTREVLCCQICYGKFSNPKQLPCLHTFCEECIGRHLSVYKMQFDSKPGVLPCPTCREIVDLPPQGVAGFRHDFKVMKFADILRELDTDHGWTKACQVCRMSENTIPAEFFCNVCNKYFCAPCLTGHNKVKVFLNHETVRLKEREKSKVLCKDHSDYIEMIRYFCDVCEIGVCTMCTLTKHEHHKVVDVTSGIIKQREKLKRLLAEVLCQVSDVERASESITNERDEIADVFENLRSEIRNHARRRIADIQEEERRLLLDLNNRERLHHAGLQKDGSILIDFKTKLNLCEQKAKELVGEVAGSVHSQLANFDELTQEVNTVICQQRQPIDSMTRHVLRFSPGMMILGSLEECIGPRHDVGAHYWTVIGGGNEHYDADRGEFIPRHSIQSHRNSVSTGIFPARGSPIIYRLPYKSF